MKEQTQTEYINLVTEDGEHYYQAIPSVAEIATEALASRVAAVKSNIALEVRMFAFDLVHRTNFRQVRHELVEQRRQEQFAESIGLVSVKGK